MKKPITHPNLRGILWFAGAGLCLASLVGAPLIHSLISNESPKTQALLDLRQDLTRLGLSDKIDNDALNDILEYHRGTNKGLGEILKEPAWVNKFGLTSTSYRVTWYVSNPYDLLPSDLKLAIKNTKTPFRTRKQVWNWVRLQKGPTRWKRSLNAALIETTPLNLWRASRGAKPYAKNGEILKPIVVEHGNDEWEVRDGHIATDPRIIPTNSNVLLLVRINGVDRVLKVKAADTGGAIKGRHVDLPIQLHSSRRLISHIVFPKNRIGNPSVQILTPISDIKSTPLKTNPGQKV